MPLILETNGLTKLYGGRAAVNQVSLHVKEGDIYGFIGKNGAGKTTFMRLVTGLARPDKGSMTLFGGQDFSRSRRRIGSMIEYPSLYPNMTARQNLEAHRLLLGIPEKGSVDEALKTVRLAETGNKKVKHFSLGMRQRLGIAQCLLGHPDFLILDEPINGLDPTGIKEIRDLLLTLNGEKGITILLSSHILGELAKIATCYGIINQGVLVDEFSKDELQTRCRRCLRIQVDDVKKAVQVLESILKTDQFDVLPDQTIRLFGYLEDSGTVNTTLVQNGVTVRTIAPAGQDLEGYFMQRMGGYGNA